MAGKTLLDTNVVVGLFNNDSAIINHLSRLEDVALPSIVIGELFFGALRSHRVESNLQRITAFAAGTPVVACDALTGRYFGEIKSRLWNKGRPIPDNDIWIASIAMQTDAAVFTRDAHFREVQGLQVETI
jgi:tRNA(fMet)-specific endonuclease VapC